MAARRRGLVANKAITRKLAALFWRVMVKGIDYVEYGLQPYEAKVLEAKQRSLRRVVQAMKKFAANPRDDAGFWQPAPLLAKLAAQGSSFT